MDEKKKLLSIKDLSVHFDTEDGVVKAVQGVSYDVHEGKTLAIVGESGCGKSVTSLSIMGLIPDPPGKVVNGSIKFRGVDIVGASEKTMRKIRGNDIAMIFQEPMTSLNPVYTVGQQIVEAVELHSEMKGHAAWAHAIEMLRKVGIADPDQRVHEYPHQMSGGMRQRIVIAMALACSPKIILADEPTTALDVTIQAQILDLISELQRQFHTAMILITHGLGVIAETAHRVIVMYTGKIVEQADVDDLFSDPRHPYTQGLMGSVPRLDAGHTRHTGKLAEITGMVPDLCALPSGCTFRHRCPKAMDVCRKEAPELVEVSANHWGRCHLLA
jgi:peptide/nickel transport system ATP-binding protein